jgi:MGT family glycosyltransferase
MKTFLIYTSPAKGHLYPMMDVAIKLKKQGHTVFVQTLSEEKERVINEGLEHISISPKIEALPLVDYYAKSPVSQFRSAFNTWLARAPHEIDDLNESYNRVKPDLLIIDVNTWGAGAFAESKKKPWVMFMPYCLPISSSDTPAFGPGFKPPTNFIHRTRDKIVNGIVRNAVGGDIKKLNEIRAGQGIPKLTKYEEIFSKPDIVLYRTTEPFDYPRKDLPKNILPIGPGLWAPSAETPDWIDKLPSPRILVSVSTERQDDSVIIETALKSVADETVSLIVTTAALDPKQFQALNDRTIITKFLPHAQIIDKMDLVVTHGGMGSTQRALAAGVPVCVIPCGRDQSETARRAEVSGAGKMLSKNKLNAKNLKAAIKEAMKLKSGAEKIAKAFADAGGAKKAVDAINKLIDQ